MWFFVLKSIHILGALLFLGTGIGSAWYKMRADRSGDVRVVAWCQREIVLADWLFTVPSGVLLPVTGILLARVYQLPLTTPWILTGFVGFGSAGVLWLVAAFLQIRMRDLAEAAVAAGTPLPAEFHRANRWWMALGVPAFAVALVTVWVMVSKQVPGPW